MNHTWSAKIIIHFQSDSPGFGLEEDVTLTYPDLTSAIEYASTHAHEFDYTYITSVLDPDNCLMEWDNR